MKPGLSLRAACRRPLAAAGERADLLHRIRTNNRCQYARRNNSITPSCSDLPVGNGFQLSWPQHRLFSSSSANNGKIIVKVPPMTESINEGTIASLMVKVGDQVEADDDIASIETDKVDIQVMAPEAGRIAEILISEGDVVTVGQEVAVVETEDGDASPAPASDTPKIPEKVEPAPDPTPTSAPVANKAEAITTERAVANQKGERIVKMSRRRQTIAKNLKEAQNTAATATTYQEIDMSALKRWRDENRAYVDEKYGVRLGYMGAFSKATTLAAAEVPELTATLDMENLRIIYRDFVNISIAVSTDRGLVVPVVRNTQDLSVVDLEREIAKVASKARESKLTMDDSKGGHFSISNPGIFDSLYGTPLIPVGQTAVFNLNSVRYRVVPIEGKIEIRPIMIISLSYDHRLIDGLEALKFLNLVRKHIQDPSILRLE